MAVYVEAVQKHHHGNERKLHLALQQPLAHIRCEN